MNTTLLNRPSQSAMKAPEMNSKGQIMTDSNAKPQRATKAKMEKNKGLAPHHVAGLTQFWRGLEHLANNAPKHLSTPQLTFFLLAALGSLENNPRTYSEIKEGLGDLGPTIGSTYAIFLGQSKRFPKGVNWLCQDVNPNDLRRKPLRLTDEGYDIVHQLAIAIGH